MTYKIVLNAMACMIFCSNVWSATFIYTSFEKQLRDSDAAVSGQVMGSQIIKSSDGQIYTNYTLSLKQYSGINENIVFHKDSFSFLVPGGDWQGIRYQVSGAPNFKIGDQVFLILKKTNGFFTPQNLGMSKYNFQKINGKDVLSSSVFPDHPELGKIEMEKVNSLLEKRFGKVVTLNEDHSGLNEKMAAVSTMGQSAVSRAPTSQVAEAATPKLGMFWLVVLLAGLACLKYILKLGR